MYLNIEGGISQIICFIFLLYVKIVSEVLAAPAPISNTYIFGEIIKLLIYHNQTIVYFITSYFNSVY